MHALSRKGSGGFTNPSILYGSNGVTAQLARLLATSTFYSPLRASIVPIIGPSPTFTRTGTKSFVDHEGMVRYAGTGEVAFMGARRVQNQCATTSEDFTNAAWGKALIGAGLAPVVTANYAIAPDGTQTAHRAQFDLNGANTTGDFSILSGTYTGYTNGAPVLFSIWLKSNTTASFTMQLFAFNSTYANFVVTPQWQRFVIGVIPNATTSSTFGLRLRGGVGCSNTADVAVWRAMHETVTGQVSRAPSEYVPVGTGGPALGLESVNNGSLLTNTTGWTTDNSSFTWVSPGNATLQNTAAANGYAYQIITTVVGQRYVLTGQLAVGTATLPRLVAGSSLHGAEYGTAIINGATQGTLVFTATSTTTYVEFATNSVVNGQSFTVKAASLKLAYYGGANVDGVQYFTTKNTNTTVADPFLQVTTVLESTDVQAAGSYVILPGLTGNYLSAPDSDANSITGDIDIRARVALTDWTPALLNVIVSKASLAQSGYMFSVESGGTLALRVNTSGAIDASSSVATGFTDGTAHWVRVTKVVASGQTIFYTSEDGVTWTQLGTTQTGVALAFNNNTLPLNIGVNDYAPTQMMAGLVYRVQIYNGINGTLAVDFNPNLWASGRTFRATTGEVWTVNGTSVSIISLNNVSYGGAINSGNSKWAYQPTSTGGTDYISTPSAAPIQLSNRVTMICCAALTNPAASGELILKWDAVNVQYDLSYNNGTLTARYTGAGGLRSFASSATYVPASGALAWFAVDMYADNGAGQRQAIFYISQDGKTWSMLGAPQIVAGAESITATAGGLSILGGSGATASIGRCYYAAVTSSGLNGTPLAVMNPNSYVSGTTWPSVTGETWTINGNATVFTGNLLFDQRGPLGFLDEPQRTNLAVQSEDLTTTWAVTASTISANATVAPDGNLTADKIQEDNTTAVHTVQLSIAKAAASLIYVYSVYLKQAERGWAFVQVSDGAGNGVRVWANLAAGTVGSNTAIGAGWTFNSASITPMGNGWHRLTVTSTSNAVAAIVLSLCTSTGDTVASYLGTTGSGVYAWGSQLENIPNVANAAMGYIPTVAGSATRNGDQLTHVSTINNSAGSASARVTQYDIGPTGQNIVIGTTAGGIAPLGVGNGGATRSQVYDGVTSLFSSLGATAIGASRRASSSWAGASMSAYWEGAGKQSAAYDGSFNDIGTMGIGGGSTGGLQVGGTVAEVLTFARQLTDAEIALLNNL